MSPSPWACLDGASCDFASLYGPAFPPWRRALGVAVIVMVVAAVLPLPLFVLRSRRVLALAIRQPITLSFMCAASLISLVTPYREVVGEARVPCVATSSAMWVMLACILPSAVLRIVGGYQMNRRQQRLQLLVEPGGATLGPEAAASPVPDDGVDEDGGAAGTGSRRSGLAAPRGWGGPSASNWGAGAASSARFGGGGGTTTPAPRTPRSRAQVYPAATPETVAPAVGAATLGRPPAGRAAGRPPAGACCARAAASLDAAVDSAPPLTRPRVQLAVMSAALAAYMAAFGVRVAIGAARGRLLATACRFDAGELAFFAVTIGATMAVLG